MSSSIILGGGCFWCLDAAYREVRGILSSTAGYSGGPIDHPTYKTVASGTIGHAEVVRLIYDERVISLDSILNIFWVIHDPTTPNRQGHDIGTQYRSCIFYEHDSDRAVIEASVKMAQLLWKDPIVTEVAKFKVFYPAEEEHQNYYAKNPEASYCQVVINPKLNKLRQAAAGLLA